MAIGIGTPERAKEFCQLTGYPASQLLADPENACYDALQLNKGAALTFLRPETPMALAQRAISGDTADLKEALSTWKAWIPPKLEQVEYMHNISFFSKSSLLPILNEKRL